jgi:hypothetical protein
MQQATVPEAFVTLVPLTGLLVSLARILGQSVDIILYYSLDGWVRD